MNKDIKKIIDCKEIDDKIRSLQAQFEKLDCVKVGSALKERKATLGNNGKSLQELVKEKGKELEKLITEASNDINSSELNELLSIDVDKITESDLKEKLDSLMFNKRVMDDLSSKLNSINNDINNAKNKLKDIAIEYNEVKEGLAKASSLIAKNQEKVDEFSKKFEQEIITTLSTVEDKKLLEAFNFAREKYKDNNTYYLIPQSSKPEHGCTCAQCSPQENKELAKDFQDQEYFICPHCQKITYSK